MLETIVNAILPHIFEIIMTILSLIIANYVLPYVKNDLIPWMKEKHIYNIVKSFVQAAEKLAESGVIEKKDKKSKVVELLTNKGIVVDETIEAFIESCVKELDLVASVVYEQIVDADVVAETV